MHQVTVDLTRLEIVDKKGKLWWQYYMFYFGITALLLMGCLFYKGEKFSLAVDKINFVILVTH